MTADDVLPSWNEGAATAEIVDFVARVTKQGGAEFVPPAERIAAFDNDGTLWCEQPLQAQVLRDRAREGACREGPGRPRSPCRPRTAPPCGCTEGRQTDGCVTSPPPRAPPSSARIPRSSRSPAGASSRSTSAPPLSR